MLENNKNKLIKEKIFELIKEYHSEEAFTNASSQNIIIPPSGKLIDHEELINMTDAVLDGWLTHGRYNQRFEETLSNFLDVKKVLTVNSGSSANLIAFYTLTSPKLKERAIKKGDEIISVAAGFPTTVNPSIQYGAVPVFVDIDLKTYNICADKIEAAITKKTKAIMLAHTLGNPYNLEVVSNLCEKYNLWLIEDTCDALGSTYNGKKVGTFGDIGTLSFYPAHHITMGEGGAVFTNSLKLWKIAQSIRDWGRDCYCDPGKDNTCGRRFGWKLGDLPRGYDHKYTYSHLGFNLKITDIQAACGLAQLKKLNSFIKIRRENFKFLKTNLKGLDEFIVLPEPTKNSVPSWFGFPITLNKKCKLSRDELVRALNEKGIGTRLLFAGNLIKQPYMENVKFKVHDNLHNTDVVMNNTFWIGLQPSLTKDMLKFSSDTIRKLVEK